MLTLESCQESQNCSNEHSKRRHSPFSKRDNDIECVEGLKLKVNRLVCSPEKLCRKKEKINSSVDSGTDAEQQEYELAKTKLCRIFEERADGAILHSKIRCVENGEKPT